MNRICNVTHLSNSWVRYASASVGAIGSVRAQVRITWRSAALLVGGGSV